MHKKSFTQLDVISMRLRVASGQPPTLHPSSNMSIQISLSFIVIARNGLRVHGRSFADSVILRRR